MTLSNPFQHSIHRITDSADAPRFVDFLSRTFGPRTNTHESVLRWIARESVSLLEVRAGSETIAVSVARWNDQDEWADGLTLEPETLGGYLGKRIGTFQLLAVSPSHQRQGLGRLLCSAQYEWMRAQGCRGAIGLAWQHGRADASAPLFRDAGFELLAELPDYYLEGSRNDGHSCPVCGGECHCTALLFGTLW